MFSQPCFFPYLELFASLMEREWRALTGSTWLRKLYLGCPKQPYRLPYRQPYCLPYPVRSFVTCVRFAVTFPGPR